MDEIPFISAMIVVRNEEKYIGKCFRSLLEQSYPVDKYEILIIDGMSEDSTLVIAKKIEERYGFREVEDSKGKVSTTKVQVHYLENPKKILAVGWNIGIKNAKGDYVVRIDAHGYAHRDFLLNSMKTMLKLGDAVCVGGAMQSEAISEKGEIIANILSSPFGVGNAKFRYSKKAEYVDTVAFGLYKKEIFSKVGYFDETLKRNQDNDMHRRIREVGGKFFLNPEIKSTYHPRDTVKDMLKQGFQNGRWNIITFKNGKKSLSLRHLIPLFFVLGILGCGIMGFLFYQLWVLLVSVLAFYLALGLVFSLKKTRKLKQVLVMPFLFLLFHILYGMGSLISIFNCGGKN